jgi:putative transposase
VRRYHVRPDGPWLRVFGRDHGLAQPLCPELGAFDDAGQKVLRISRLELFNTDQGAQLTSQTFVDALKDNGIRINMARRGRVHDNIIVEPFWRSAKYEEIYLHEFRTVAEARAHLADYFRLYNEEWPYAAQGCRTPREIYYGTRAALAPVSE